MDASASGGRELPDASNERRRRRAITLAIGGGLLVAGLVATLAHGAKQRLATNRQPVQVGFATLAGRAPMCQSGERIPAGTAAIRVSLMGDVRAAPQLALALADGRTTRATGAAGARWDGASAVVVPLVQPLRADLVGRVCIRTPPTQPPAAYLLLGAPTAPARSATAGGERLGGRVRMEYLPAERGTWWSSLPTLVARIGRGHAWSGPSVALVAALLTLSSIAVGAWQLVRRER